MVGEEVTGMAGSGRGHVMLGFPGCREELGFCRTQWKQLKSVTGMMRPDRLDSVEGARTRGRQTAGNDSGPDRQKENALFWLDGWGREEANTGGDQQLC